MALTEKYGKLTREQSPGKALHASSCREAAMFNKHMQQTKIARRNFSIVLSHNGLLPIFGLLPVERARFLLLM